MPTSVEAPARTGPAATAALCGVVLIYTVLESMLAPALPLIQAGVDASAASIAWVFTGPGLAAAVCTPLISRLADVHDKKKVFFGVLAVVVAGVVLAGAATSVLVLAVGQTLQGAGLGFVPLALGILRDSQDQATARNGNGLVIGLSGFGVVAGLLLAGPLLTVLPYRWLYWIPLAVLLLIGAVAFRLLPAMAPADRGSVDWAGAGLLGTGLLALLIGVTMAPTWGWGSVAFLALEAGAVACLVLFVVVERRVDQPLVDFRVGGRAVLVTCGVAFTVGWSTVTTSLTMPTIVAAPPAVGYGLGSDAATAGLLLVPLGVVAMVAASLTGRLERIVGSRPLMVLSCLPIVAAVAAMFAGRHDAWVLALSSGLMGLGTGIGLTQAMNVVAESVPARRVTSVSGLVLVIRAVGGTLGAQVAGSLLGSDTVAGTPLPTWPAFSLVFLVGTVVAIAAAATAFTLPRHAASR
ncbi:MFS transporter [Amycolatopsis suaedae]|uniref:MFS transporter n=1 Tax=Amycolatopsis suaedae TaxID=2510978 RepID=A0A4V2EMC6_9PSEU|nr:MFS transporter [Amycolatopsis suaedae]RZQ64595.1 MFS transporter [Amycolatopsis suaedae]